MRQRGKKKSHDVTPAVTPDAGLPQRPAFFDDDAAPPTEAQIWERVAGSMPPDWFRPEHYEMLKHYCVCSVLSYRYAKQLKEEQDLKAAEALLRDYNSILRQITTLATKMRITHQSKYDERTAHRKMEGGKKSSPWEG
jgi:hypothetical protein